MSARTVVQRGMKASIEEVEADRVRSWFVRCNDTGLSKDFDTLASAEDYCRSVERSSADDV